MLTCDKMPLTLISMPMAFYDARRVGDLNSHFGRHRHHPGHFHSHPAELFRGLILIVEASWPWGTSPWN